MSYSRGMKILKLSLNLSRELSPDEATSAIPPEQSIVFSATGEQSMEFSSTDEQSHSLSSELPPDEVTPAILPQQWQEFSTAKEQSTVCSAPDQMMEFSGVLLVIDRFKCYSVCVL